MPRRRRRQMAPLAMGSLTDEQRDELREIIRGAIEHPPLMVSGNPRRGMSTDRIAVVGTPAELVRALDRAPPRSTVMLDEAAAHWRPTMPNFIQSEEDLRVARRAAEQRRVAQAVAGRTLYSRGAFNERVLAAGRAVATRRRRHPIVSSNHDCWNEESEVE